MPDLERRPAVAGTFYPGNPGRLENLVDALLDASGAGPPGPPGGGDAAVPGPAPGPDTMCGLLVPHAGLVYSGSVAAAAWRLLRRHPRATVVLAGTNHFAPLAGIGVWPDGAWVTPLGRVAIDDEVRRLILDLGPPFVPDRSAHLQEHSLEVQLPFLLRVAPETTIVPLSVSAGTDRRAVEAGERLGRALGALRRGGRDVLLVASSDCAHYPAARHAEAVNEALRVPLELVDAAALARTEAEIRMEGIRGLACGMCGIEPAVLTLAAVRAMGATIGRVLATATSADVAGADPGRTVGYVSAVFEEADTLST